MTSTEWKPSCMSCHDGSCPECGISFDSPCGDYVGYRPPAKPPKQEPKYIVLRPRPDEKGTA